jgi:dihydroxyacetone kinase-like protein
MLAKGDVQAAVALMADTVIENRDYLNELDGAIGDADFGTSISGGFQAVKDQLEELSSLEPGPMLSKVGLTLVSKVGGASGPIYGTIFMKAGQAAGVKTGLAAEDIAGMLEAAITGVKARGKAEPGEKTIVDALQPAAEAFRRSVNSGGSLAECCVQATLAARAGAEQTKNMIATKGRAHYVGERALGHRDAGAVSIALLFEAVCTLVKK